MSNGVPDQPHHGPAMVESGGVRDTEARVPLWRRPEELLRWAIGVVGVFVVRAYGVAGAISAALSDGETFWQKAKDAILVVPNLTERYDQAQYLIEHRAQIQRALDYVHNNAPDGAQLESAAQQSAQTLDRLSTTYDEVAQAQESLRATGPTNFWQTLPEVKDHVSAAWDSWPDLDSIERLRDVAKEVVPFLDQVNAMDVDFPKLYSGLLSVVDNFASDEILSTLIVMAMALLTGYAASLGVGFWARRGRPTWLASKLHEQGGRTFNRWYAVNPEFAPPLHAGPRARLTKEIVADPEKMLSPGDYRSLAAHFADREGTSSP